MANSYGTDVDGLTNGARDAFGNVIREVKNLSATLSEDAKTRTDKMARKVEKQSKAAFSNLQQTVQEKPGMAVGIALGAGVFLGLLLSSRR